MSDKAGHKSMKIYGTNPDSYHRFHYHSKSHERSQYDSRKRPVQYDDASSSNQFRSRSHDRNSYDSKRYDKRSYNHTANSHSQSRRNRRSRTRSPRRNSIRHRSRSRSTTQYRHSPRCSQQSSDRTEESLGENIKSIDQNMCQTTDNTEELYHEAPVQSVFKNDGSFLEMFKKMQEENTPSTVQIEKNLNTPLIGRRRGGKVLKTGIVEKIKVPEDNDDSNKSKDPWSIYINEVKKYRQASCQDEGKTRSLVK